MKNFKIGFTLTEVLVAMGLLGVIGAMLIPQVVTNTQKNEAGALLGNATEQISLGVRNLIMHANETSIDGSLFDTYDGIKRRDLFGASTSNPDTEIRGEHLFSDGGAFFSTTALSETETSSYSVKDFSGNTSNDFTTAINANTTKKFKNSKNNMYYMVIPLETVAQDVDTITDVIVVDVNGADNPNRIGKDVFMFGLTANGSMVPAGSQVFLDSVPSVAVPTMENGCTNNNISNGLSCTARIVKDGFKIKYY